MIVSRPELVLASRNRKKSAELAELLAPHGIAVVSVAEFSEVPEIEEDRDSFAGNAAKKACETALRIGRWVIAEDSGLCVDALSGAPRHLFGPLQRPRGDRRTQQRQAHRRPRRNSR